MWKGFVQKKRGQVEMFQINETKRSDFFFFFFPPSASSRNFTSSVQSLGSTEVILQGALLRLEIVLIIDISY